MADILAESRHPRRTTAVKGDQRWPYILAENKLDYKGRQFHTNS